MEERKSIESDGQQDFSQLVGKYLIFRLDDVKYGLEVACVREIVQSMETTKIPNAPAYMRGLINLRGKTIPVVELRGMFGLQAVEDSNTSCIIIIEVTSARGIIGAGLVVDEVAEVLELDEEHLAQTPELGTEENAKFVKGVGVYDGTITMLLDVVNILGFDDFDFDEIESGGVESASVESVSVESEPAERAPVESAPVKTENEEPEMVEPGIVKHISALLSELPMDSAEYKATSGMLEKMQEFFSIMQEADSRKLDHILAEFDTTEQPLLQELGKLVRKFHDQIKTVSSDIPDRLGEIAEHDMVNATQRLEHIVEMTEQAATTTIGLAEDIMTTLVEEDKSNGALLEKLDQTLGSGGLEPETEKVIREAAETLKKKSLKEKEYQNKLTEILMAQGYQDLTGQVIQKIVVLIEKLEGELLMLVKAFGTSDAMKEEKTDKLVLEGPQSEKSVEKKSQDEVDNLLESLGF